MTAARLADVKSIDPKLHPRYSPNLYNWMARGPGKRYGLHNVGVYRGNDNNLWIGYVGQDHPREIIGSRLMGALCNGARETTACWVNFKVTEVVDFWDRYTAIGRCAIDPEHTMFFINDESRWATDGDARSCQWCGKAHQTIQRWTETVERSAWAMVPSANPPI